MKVMFLDIDGVLNTDAWFKNRPRSGISLPFDAQTRSRDLNPALVERLNEIVEATNCSIVVTSTWRLPAPTYGLPPEGVLAFLRKALRMAGFKYGDKIVGTTPFLTDRPAEIEFYIKKHSLENAAIVIVDDWDMDHLSPLLVQTSYWSPDGGIQDWHKREIIRRLNEPRHNR